MCVGVNFFRIFGIKKVRFSKNSNKGSTGARVLLRISAEFRRTMCRVSVDLRVPREEKRRNCIVLPQFCFD